MAARETIEDYVQTRPTTRRFMLGSVGLTIDRTSEACLTLPEMDRSVLIVDLAGTPGRVLRIGRQAFEGSSPAGSVACVPAGHEAFVAWERGTTDKICLVLDFDSVAVHCVAPEVLGGPCRASRSPDLRFERSAEMVAIADLLRRETDPAGQRGALFRDTALRMLFLELHAHMTGQERMPGRAVPDRRLRRALDYIEAHFDKELSMTDLCAASGMSASQITTLFRSQMNTSPYAYVIEWRLSRAVHLLQRSDIPLAVIALDCGFSDQSHMTRLFRARLGRTPASYRRGARADA